jgi:hypothetical protein
VNQEIADCRGLIAEGPIAVGLIALAGATLAAQAL